MPCQAAPWLQRSTSAASALPEPPPCKGTWSPPPLSAPSGTRGTRPPLGKATQFRGRQGTARILTPLRAKAGAHVPRRHPVAQQARTGLCEPWHGCAIQPRRRGDLSEGHGRARGTAGQPRSPALSLLPSAREAAEALPTLLSPTALPVLPLQHPGLCPDPQPGPGLQDPKTRENEPAPSSSPTNAGCRRPADLSLLPMTCSRCCWQRAPWPHHGGAGASAQTTAGREPPTPIPVPPP